MSEPVHAIAGDALAGLQELPLPPPVSYVPQTIGWVIVAAVLGVIAALIVWRVVRHRRLNAYRREALAELELIERAALEDAPHPTSPRFAEGGVRGSAPVPAPPSAKRGEVGWGASPIATLPALLKRTAIAATSRDHVATLTGDDWLRFLDRTLGGDAFSQGKGQLLTRLAYDDGTQLAPDDLRELLRLSRRWIAHHHADV